MGESRLKVLIFTIEAPGRVGYERERIRSDTVKNFM